MKTANQNRAAPERKEYNLHILVSYTGFNREGIWKRRQTPPPECCYPVEKLSLLSFSFSLLCAHFCICRISSTICRSPFYLCPCLFAMTVTTEVLSKVLVPVSMQNPWLSTMVWKGETWNRLIAFFSKSRENKNGESLDTAFWGSTVQEPKNLLVILKMVLKQCETLRMAFRGNSASNKLVLWPLHVLVHPCINPGRRTFSAFHHRPSTGSNTEPWPNQLLGEH